MKYLKLFESYNTETELDEAMQWFVDQFDVTKTFNRRKTICAYATRDKFQITPDIVKELTRLSHKIKCSSKIDLGYKIGTEDKYYKLSEKFTSGLCKALLDYVTKNEIYSNQMIISFVFAESNDLLDPYYTPEGLDRDVIYFDGVPYDLFAKLISSKEIDPEDQIANSIFTHSCFLNDLKNYATRITFNGLRVIDRSDARVSIEGFTIKDLTDDEMNELENTYGNADEFILNRKNRTLHTWWD